MARAALGLTASTERWVPDAFIFALGPTLVVVIAAVTATPAPLWDVILAWGDGFWDLIPFTQQMSLVIITGHVLATSPPMGRLIGTVAGWPRSPRDRINPGARAGDHVFVTRINGEDHFVFFNKRDERSMATVRALKNNDIDPMLDELAFSALITRYYASVSTQWNPFFGVKNFGRDMLEAGITLKATPLAGKQLSVWANAFKALPALWNVERGLRGLQQINMANPLTAKYQQYKKAGGPTGHLDYFNGNMERANGLAKELEFLRGEGKKIGNLKVPQAGWTAFRYVFGFIEDMNTALENATRFAAFNVAMQQGMSESKAAVLAKELTVNFNDNGRADSLRSPFNSTLGLSWILNMK